MYLATVAKQKQEFKRMLSVLQQQDTFAFTHKVSDILFACILLFLTYLQLIGEHKSEELVSRNHIQIQVVMGEGYDF